MEKQSSPTLCEVSFSKCYYTRTLQHEIGDNGKKNWLKNTEEVETGICSPIPLLFIFMLLILYHHHPPLMALKSTISTTSRPLTNKQTCLERIHARYLNISPHYIPFIPTQLKITNSTGKIYVLLFCKGVAIARWIRAEIPQFKSQT